MSVDLYFEYWRKIKSSEKSWGLAWYLAYGFCKRFYASHGIVPHVICKEGMGYYGIQLDYVRCSVNGKEYKQALGRLTASGDVENWRIGGPGDHGLETSQMCTAGVTIAQILSQAIKYMNLPAMPDKTHLNCRHKRWGASYELAFEIATIFAFRNDPPFKIWNHLYNTERVIKEFDEKADMKEHPGAFIFSLYDKEFILTGDGRVLGQSRDNLWDRYMLGESSYTLCLEIEQYLLR
ncbi:MAG: hypothetical protein JXM72_12975 [Deltaproteobacteria bacterium]|nr:hypothetical protein [Deltaproteobacteria bacterium]